MSPFSQDCAEARARFLRAARAAGAELAVLDLEAKGPRGENLAIDIAWFGATHPRTVLVHCCGVHGIEAFAGSAVQLEWLSRGEPAAAKDAAIVLVHVANPYGMAWLRRVNENNVDLNRNVLAAGEKYSGAPPLYRKIERFLNPQTPPSRDPFYPRAAALIARYGLKRLTEAIAAGQYEYPRGLFYGGDRLEEGPQKLLDFLRERLEAAEALTAVDLHTGLGPWAQETLLEHTSEGRAESRPGAAYPVRGAFGMLFPLAAPQARVRYVLQEIGTYRPVRVLRALREENRWAQFGTGAADHPSKAGLREVFSPEDPAWREEAVKMGTALIRRVLA